MASDIWEQAVETYLAIDRGLFLNPQYLIGTPNVWEANPDFLALVFPEKVAWMVEVTKAPRSALFDKVRDFERDYAPRIRDQLEKSGVIRRPQSGDDTWAIGLWVFAPEATLPRIQQAMERAGVHKHCVTALEETLKPSAWENRFRPL
jgi:hypothetical protein